MKLKTIKAVVAAVGIGLGVQAWNGSLAAPQPTSKPALDPAITKSMAAAYANLDKLLKEMPRDQFDSAAIVEAAGRDPSALQAWVKDNTRLLPYRGALRGATGVLLDRGGNSLDRSLLLADLLRQAGYEVRLANATLTAAQAGELLDRTAMAAAPAADGEVKQLRQRVQVQADRLLKELGAVPAANARADALADVADHWWVQRKGTGESWIDQDPAGVANATPTRTVPFTGELATLPVAPAEAQEVDVRVVIEAFRGGKLQSETVLNRTFRPAEIIGRSLVFSHFVGRSPAAKGDAKPDLKAQVRSQKQFLPTLWLDGRAFRDAAFNTDGEVDRNPQMDPAGKLAGQFGKTAGNAFGGLTGDAPAAGQPGVLTAQWLEYEIRTPGKKPTLVRREVFDLLGPAARQAGISKMPVLTDAQQLRRGLLLNSQTQILLQGCELTPAYVMYQLARSEAKDAKTWLALGRGEGGPEQNVTRLLNQQYYRDETTPMFAMIRDGVVSNPDALYIDRPNVVQFRRWLEEDKAGELVARQGMDLAYTSTAVVPAVADAFRLRVEQGVADTLAEHLAIGEGAVAGENTVAILEGSPNAVLTVVRPDQVAGLAKLNLPSDTAARVSADLAAGHIVVLSPGLANGRWTWWRVHPATGQTVGVMDTGYNQSIAEREAQIQAELNGYASQIGRDLTNKAVRTAKPGDIAGWVRSAGGKVKNPEGVIKNLEGIQLELQTLWRQQAAMRGIFF